MRRAADALVAVVLAPACAACTRPLDSPLSGCVCDACWTLVTPLRPPLCRTCGDQLPSWRHISRAMDCCAACRRAPPLIACARSTGDYEGALRAIIHAFKYEGRRSLAYELARRMRDDGADVLQGADLLVPVPLHRWRRFRRGFNQASDLAARLPLPHVAALTRTRLTRPQTGLSARARRRNVRDAFAIAPSTAAVDAAVLRGQVVVLVDDVRTTGATLEACAAVLIAAGAREVRALTAARAALSHDRSV